MDNKKETIHYEIEQLPSSSGVFLFDNDTISSLTELGSVLEKIHKRLTSEGYIIENGKIRKLDIIKF